MKIYGRIAKIGTWSPFGWPVDWEVVPVDLDEIGGGAVMQIMADGKVCVNGIEIVPWTEARFKAMGV